MSTTKMFWIIIIFLALSIFALSSFGQSNNGVDYKNYTPEKKARVISDNLKPVLNLSDKQYNEIYNIYLDRIRWKSVNNVDGIYDKSLKRKNYEMFKSKLNGVLTIDQLKDLKKYCNSKKKQ